MDSNTSVPYGRVSRRYPRPSKFGPASRLGLALLAVSLPWFQVSATAALQVQKGTFNKSTGVGAQAIGTVGFQPQAVIFFWTRQNVLDTREDGIRSGYGFAADPAEERAIAISSDHNVGTSVSGRWQSQSRSILILADGTPTLGAEAELTSFDPTGFSLNWITNDGRDDIIHYLAIGGSDLADASAGTFTKDAGLGNQPVCGLGFQPDLVMLMSISSGVNDAGDPHAQANIGFFSAPRERAAVASNMRDNQTTLFGARNTHRLQRTDRAFAELTTDNNATEEALLDVVAFEPDGFTIDKEVNTGTGEPIHYLALKGGSYKVGNFIKNTTTAPPTQSQSITGVGFQPKGLILMSTTGPVSAAVGQEGRVTFGATDGTNEGITWWHDDSGSSGNATIARQRTTTTEIMLHEAAEQGTVQARATLASFDADGFSLDWTLNETSAYEVLYVALGDDPNPQVNYRSIGNAAPYAVNTVEANNGSPVVIGDTTMWKSANRGRGDRITILGADYTILSVDSETQLTLTTNYGGGSGTGKAYSITRLFGTLPSWENCVSANVGCGAFPVVSNDLVSDNRREVGVVYDDGLDYSGGLVIDGSLTDRKHDITLTVAPGNRHYGIENAGVRVDNGGSATPAIQILDENVTLEWLEIIGGSGTSAHAIEINGLAPDNKILLRGLLVHDSPSDAIHIIDADTIADIFNNFIYETRVGIFVNTPLNNASWIRILNNTVYSSNRVAADPSGIVGDTAQTYPSVTLINNIAHSNVSSVADKDFGIPARNAASRNNLASDTTGGTHSPAGGGIDSALLGNLNFQDDALPGADLHILSPSDAETAGVDLDCICDFDIDGGARPPGWDIGADDIEATTAVELVRFTAEGEDEAVTLRWETASELNNLGFHLYRASSPSGPYVHITETAIPGLGSSPVGARYDYRDLGLNNGTTYHYQLEDIETGGRTERHGPVSATPAPGHLGSRSPETESPVPDDGGALLTYGAPEENAFRVLEEGPRHRLLELSTRGFYAESLPDGSVRIRIPGFLMDEVDGASGPAPVKRVSIAAPAGREVEILSAVSSEVETIEGWIPREVDEEVVADRSGAVRLRSTRRRTRDLRPRRRGSEDLHPPRAARLVSIDFQGDEKRALVELAPLRRVGDRWVLAKRLVVRIGFEGREASERLLGGKRARRYRGGTSHERHPVLIRLVTRQPGLYALSYDRAFGSRGRPLATRRLRLSRQGRAVAFHIEPEGTSFAPGSRLYFYSSGAVRDPLVDEAVFELEWGRTGIEMPTHEAAPWGSPAPFYWKTLEWEENHYYQAALVDAPDRWLWSVLLAPTRQSFPLDVEDLASTSDASALTVWLQGASDLPPDPDHHVRLYLNGTAVAERRWDGKAPEVVEAALPAGLLRVGGNALEIENLGDTDAAYSMVMLNRIALSYPRRLPADATRFEGSFPFSGTAALPGLDFVLDTTDPTPRWLTPLRRDEGLRFGVQEGRRYLSVRASAVQTPALKKPRLSALKEAANQADYLILGSEDLLREVRPLLRLRREQGLRARAVPLEEIYSEFGFGESRPEAIREFLRFAYHRWKAPSPRFVLLVGDATYDPKDHLQTGAKNLLPPMMVKTSYLWTASDPAYAAVNGEDRLPDLAIGRLPAASRAELRVMVEKILAYERATPVPRPVVLVADDPDEAGQFVANAEDLANGALSGIDVRRIYLNELGVESARSAVVSAFDDGTPLMSYIGHGGIHLWAQENLFDNAAATNLLEQSDQPILLTMNCLNGYFHFPYFNSLSEELLKAEHKGVIAAFSPTGLSLDAPAHRLHRALLTELRGGGHQRLGEAIFAAQKAYAVSGDRAELLSIYHLLGDPALTLRPIQ